MLISISNIGSCYIKEQIYSEDTMDLVLQSHCSTEMQVTLFICPGYWGSIKSLWSICQSSCCKLSKARDPTPSLGILLLCFTILTIRTFPSLNKLSCKFKFSCSILNITDFCPLHKALSCIEGVNMETLLTGLCS